MSTNLLLRCHFGIYFSIILTMKRLDVEHYCNSFCQEISVHCNNNMKNTKTSQEFEFEIEVEVVEVVRSR